MNRRSVAVLLALCLSAGTLMAGDSGQQVAVDQNGQLRQPTVQEQQSLTAAPSGKPLVVKTTSTGAVTIALDDQFDHMYVAHLNEAGELVFTCTDDHAAAAALVAQPTTSIMRLRPANGAKRVAERE